MEVAPVLEVSRAEEGGAEPSVCKHPLCDCLCDGALSRPSETIQPINRGLLEVASPEFNFVQNRSAGTFEATIAISMSILGLFRTSEIVDDSCFSYRREIF